MESNASLTLTARLLGYAGLLPQIICLTLVLTQSDYRFTALFMGFVYAAVIFSFLGGVWWGQAISAGGEAKAAVYTLSVLPSLIAAALFFPLNIGWEWPGPALLYLGAFIALSPMIDRALGYAAPDFMSLRWQLSLGLGGLTIALGVLAMSAMAPAAPANPHASPAAATEIV